MTKATPAGRTLTEDPTAVPGGNPSDPESGPVSRPAAWTEKPRARERLGVFLFIYLTAGDEPQLSTSYVVVMDPATTKTYVRELRRFGGNAADCAPHAAMTSGR
jgi:hypothetical protein